MRAVIDPRSNEVSAVDAWATQIGDLVDVSIGPDGSLYHLAHNGAVGA